MTFKYISQKMFPVMIMLCFIACRDTKPKHQPGHLSIEDGTSTTYFEKFPPLRLPLALNGCDIDISKLALIDEGTYAVGRFSIPDGIATVTFEAADCMLPVLTTYTEDGKTISSETIAIGYCDDGPCQVCSEYMEINKQFQLYTSDTTRIYPCDNDYNKIEGKETTRVIYKKGFIHPDGTIELSDEKRKEL